LVNWIQNISSSIKPTIIGNFIFSLTNDGYLVILDSSSGSIIRKTNIFSHIKDKKRKKLKVSGFIVGKDKIYVSTNKGKILVVSILNGKTISSLKIDNNQISRPFVLNQNLFVIKDNGIIKIE